MDIPLTSLGVPPLTLTVAQTKELTGLGHSTVWALITAGTLESTTIGRRRLVLTSSLLKLVDPNAPPEAVLLQNQTNREQCLKAMEASRAARAARASEQAAKHEAKREAADELARTTAARTRPIPGKPPRKIAA